MATTPPYDRRKLVKDGIFDDDRFYRLLSENCGYISKDLAKQFYSALVRLMTSEMRTNGVVRLPHIGEIALVPEAPRPRWAGKVQVVMSGLRIIRFYPKTDWRDYFNKL